MTKNTFLFSGLATLGIISLAVSFYLNKKITHFEKPSLQVATAERNFGSSFLTRKSYNTKEPIYGTVPLYSLDTVEVGANAELTLEFPSGQSLTVLENSVVTISKEDNSTIAILKRGQVEPLKTEGSETILISKNGVRWALQDYQNLQHQSKLEQLPPSVNNLKTANGVPISNGVQISDTPTPEYISSVLIGNQDAFQKCYSQLILRSPDAKGDCSISFTLNKNGKTQNVKTIACSTGDKVFSNCLQDVVKRVQFKSFNGDAINTVFPLKFE